MPEKFDFALGVIPDIPSNEIAGETPASIQQQQVEGKVTKLKFDK
jgi:hypothetical protein